ncbi:similar to An12g05640 [Aspergillus luchuensis]|uniref:Similar to An12g05640 n=1 Tax=Aspergillus kawachii TaxID=1069201 RepID=A0A146FXG8_ASPKA|nr:similar to An12g05640 [Aspergillus luchuensis]
MSIYSHIATSKERHDQIQAELASVESSPESLQSQESYLAELRNELTNTNRQLSQLHKITKGNRELHEKYRDSTVRRLFYRARGKREEFEAKADQEMRDYYDALAKENRAQAQREMLEAQVVDAVAQEKELRRACTTRERLHAELDAIYKRIFEGRTEEFPEEDAQEETTKQARREYGQRRERWSDLRQATQCLARAQLTLREVLLNLAETLRYCERDLWSFGSTLADWRQQDCLSRAQQKVTQTQMLVAQARRLDPRVQALPAMNIVQHDWVGELVFGTFLFHTDFLGMMQQSVLEVKRAEEVLAAQVRQAKSREDDMQAQVEDARMAFETAQQDLRQLRYELFMKTADPPPPYTEPMSPGISV